MIITNPVGYYIGYSGPKNGKINNVCTSGCMISSKAIFNNFDAFSSLCWPLWCIQKKFKILWGKQCSVAYPKLHFFLISARIVQPWTRTHYSDDAKTIHKAEENCPLWLIKGIHQELWGCLKSPYFNFQASQVGFNFSFMYTYLGLRIYLSFSISQVTFFTPTSSSTMGAMHSYRNWVNVNCTVAHFFKELFSASWPLCNDM